MPSVRPRWILVGILLTTGFGVPRGAAAQTGTPRIPGWCWRGRPLPQCSDFIITDTAILAGPTAPARRPPANVRWEVGWMKNVDAAWAAGASAFVIYDDEERYLLGMGPRGRYWLRPDLGLDAGLGIILRDLKQETFVVDAPSFSGFVGATWADRLGLVVGLEVLNVQRTPDANPLLVGRQTTVFVGVRFGALAGVLGGALAGALIHVGNQAD